MQIQVDLSAMLDGELDAPSVRRVMVHSDACPSCRGFLAGIRQQVRLHRDVAAVDAAVIDTAGVEAEGSDSDAEGRGSAPTARLRHALVENRQRLSKILYELGRCFVLMGLSPDFSREVSKEPVPMPDMAQRGRNFLDEVARSVEAGGPPGLGGHVGDGSEWVAARELFDGHWCSQTESLAKGQRLLTECLGLAPDSHESRIYLGLVHHVRGQRSLAKKQFQLVLAGTDDRVVRGYALLNLGNLYLDEGDCDAAALLLREVVESGAVERQPRLGMAYFNLGLAYGLKGEFEESLLWFRRLHDELPHRRGAVARELRRRSQFLHLVRSNPGVQGAFAETLPVWFSEAG
ncbi:MAG: tetratricopeptide repeat protein [Planctomycetes bacterium]|nr:tetratricopeptide repeat protein [Planctomycetota bacterium]